MLKSGRGRSGSRSGCWCRRLEAVLAEAANTSLSNAVARAETAAMPELRLVGSWATVG